MQPETISAIATVLISSLVAIIPSLLLFNANRKKLEAEAEKIDADASNTAAELTDKLNDTAIDWIDKMTAKLKEAENLITSYKIEKDGMRKHLLELSGKVAAIEAENTRLRQKLRVQTDKLAAASETIQLQDEKITSMQAHIETIQEANLEYVTAIKILIDQLKSENIQPRYILPKK